MARQISFICWLLWNKTIQLLIFLLLHDVYNIIAVSQEKISYVSCKEENPSNWSFWYEYEFVFVSTGTKCYTGCFDSNCTCSLMGSVLSSDCLDEKNRTSSKIPYSFDIRYLNWAYSALHDIKPGSFAMFESTLEILQLNNMHLTYLRPGVFGNLSRLEWLWLNDNFLFEIHPSLFEDLITLKWLWLNSNELHKLEPGIFEGLVKLHWLDLSNNQLSVISSHLLLELENLWCLDLKNNALVELPTNLFDHARNLTLLYLGKNKLQMIDYGLLNSMSNLYSLDFSHNDLNKIEPDAFRIADVKLWHLHLNDNSLDRLDPNIFQDIKYVRELALSKNRLVSLPSDIFKSQTQLQYLYLDHNQLRYLPHDVFRTMHQLKSLNLSSNYLLQVPSNIFIHCLKLEIVDLKQNPLEWIEERSVSEMNETTKLCVTQFSTCCFTSAHCLYDVPPSPYLTCKRLLPSQILRIAIWFISILTIIANCFSFYFNFWQRRQSIKIQKFLIINLSISDILMGIYLITLLAVDMYYKDYFPSHSDSWRGSVLCRIAGALSVLSSEASALLIMLISIDRFMGVKYTFSKYRLRTGSVRCMTFFLWLIALSVSITSFAFSGFDSDFYSVSEVCVGLPISRKSTFVKTKETISIKPAYFSFGVRVAEYTKADSDASMFFSIATFTGLNLLSFFIVGYCYISIFIEVRKSSKKSGRFPNVNEEIRMAMKMSLIVFTDFCCWVPIGALSILVQAGVVEIHPIAYAWIATFVLPINSSINPLLYTLGTIVSNKIHISRWRSKNRRGPSTEVELK